MSKNQKICLSIALWFVLLRAIMLIVDYKKRDILLPNEHPVLLILAWISVLVFIAMLIWKK